MASTAGDSEIYNMVLALAERLVVEQLAAAEETSRLAWSERAKARRPTEQDIRQEAWRLLRARGGT